MQGQNLPNLEHPCVDINTGVNINQMRDREKERCICGKMLKIVVTPNEGYVGIICIVLASVLHFSLNLKLWFKNRKISPVSQGIKEHRAQSTLRRHFQSLQTTENQFRFYAALEK